MFGFLKKNDDIVVLNQKLGRLLNDLAYAEVSDQGKRSESRMRLGRPCLLLLMSEAESPQCYAVGATSDVSLHGCSVIVPEELECVEYIVAFGPKDKRLFIKAKCVRCRRTDFGTYTVGLEFLKVLHPSDYTAVVKAVDTIETPPAPVPVPPLSMGTPASPAMAL